MNKKAEKYSLWGENVPTQNAHFFVTDHNISIYSNVQQSKTNTYQFRRRLAPTKNSVNSLVSEKRS